MQNASNSFSVLSAMMLRAKYKERRAAALAAAEKEI